MFSHAQDAEKRKAEQAEKEAQEQRKLAELALQKMEEERIVRELAMRLEDKYAKGIDEQAARATEAEKVKHVDKMLEKDLTEDVKPVEDIAEPIVDTSQIGTDWHAFCCFCLPFHNQQPTEHVSWTLVTSIVTNIFVGIFFEGWKTYLQQS